MIVYPRQNVVCTLIISAILNMTCRHQDRGTTEAKTGPLRPILPRSWPEVGEKTGPFVQIQNCCNYIIQNFYFLSSILLAAILNMTCRHQDRGTTEAKTGPLRPILPRSWPEVGEKTGPFVQIQNCCSLRQTHLYSHRSNGHVPPPPTCGDRCQPVA